MLLVHFHLAPRKLPQSRMCSNCFFMFFNFLRGLCWIRTKGVSKYYVSKFLPTHPPASALSAQALTPQPHFCWHNTWIVGELLENILRQVFKDKYKLYYYRKKDFFGKWKLTTILALFFSSPTLSIQSVIMSAVWIRPPPPPVRNVSIWIKRALAGLQLVRAHLCTNLHEI